MDAAPSSGRASDASPSTPPSTSAHPGWIHPSARSFYDSPEVRNAVRCKTRRGVLNLAVDAAWRRWQELKRPVLWLEFGVWKGTDIAHIAGKLREKWGASRSSGGGDLSSGAPVIHGFDSFQGLPQDWKKGNAESETAAFPKGAFDLFGIPPIVAGDNVKLHRGWFEDTLPGFLDESRGNLLRHASTTAAFSASSEWTASKSEKNSVSKKTKKKPVLFVHADADLYSSTFFFLQQLFTRNLIVKGTILVFDEFTNYDGWEHGESLAWRETTIKFGVTFEYLAIHAPKDDDDVSNDFKHGYQSVCVLVLSVGGR